MLYIPSCQWWQYVANLLTEMYRSSSVLDENWLRIRSLYLPSTKTTDEPIHGYCTFVSLMEIGTWSTNFHEMKIGVRSADYRKWTLDRRSEAVRREKKPLSLLCASQLVVSDVAAWWLARSFAKKNFKKNIWDQDSCEPFRRLFKIDRTGSPYRWTRP